MTSSNLSNKGEWDILLVMDVIVCSILASVWYLLPLVISLITYCIILSVGVFGREFFQCVDSCSM